MKEVKWKSLGGEKENSCAHYWGKKQVRYIAAATAAVGACIVVLKI